MEFIMEYCTMMNGQTLRCFYFDYSPFLYLAATIAIVSIVSIIISNLSSKIENASSKKKSYEQEMATYDHLEIEAIEHLPTGISLDKLRQSDGEIPERVEETQS